MKNSVLLALGVLASSVPLVGCGSSSRGSSGSAAAASTSSSPGVTSTATTTTTTTTNGSALALVRVSPDSGPARGQVVTLEGANFRPGLSVEFDGQPALQVDVLSPTSARVHAPALSTGLSTVTASVAGEQASLPQVYRVLPDRLGELDPTFGLGGVASATARAPGTTTPEVFDDVAVDSQGRVLAVGQTAGTQGTPGSAAGNHDRPSVVVARFLPDGQLDSTYGLGGFARVERVIFGSPLRESAAQILVDAQDRAWVGINVEGMQISQLSRRYRVCRLTPQGTLDPTFGTNGLSVREARDAVVESMALDSAGRLLVAGRIAGRFTPAQPIGPFSGALWRYTATGQFDPTFGVNGLQAFPGLDRVADVCLDAQGRILLAGELSPTPTDQDAVIMRLAATGATDATFGFGGQRIFGGVGTRDAPRRLLLDSQQRLIVATQEATSAGPRATIRRCLPDGALDGTFGVAGMVDLLNLGVVSISGLVVAPGDRVVIAGESAGRHTLLQLTSGGTPDSDFAFGLPFTVAFAAPSGGLALDAESRLVTANSGPGMRVARVR